MTSSSQNEYEIIVLLSLFYCFNKSLPLPQPPTLPITNVSTVDGFELIFNKFKPSRFSVLIGLIKIFNSTLKLENTFENAFCKCLLNEKAY